MKQQNDTKGEEAKGTGCIEVRCRAALFLAEQMNRAAVPYLIAQPGGPCVFVLGAASGRCAAALVIDATGSRFVGFMVHARAGQQRSTIPLGLGWVKVGLANSCCWATTHALNSCARPRRRAPARRRSQCHARRKTHYVAFQTTHPIHTSRWPASSSWQPSNASQAPSTSTAYFSHAKMADLLCKAWHLPFSKSSPNPCCLEKHHGHDPRDGGAGRRTPTACMR